MINNHEPVGISLLHNFNIIRKKYDEFAQITGEKFNIFSVLRLESDEVRLHSRLLGELLNPYGSHSQSALFLKIFISQIGLENHYTNDQIEKAQVIVEENIGEIPDDYTKGGRIDLVIKFPNNKEIVIENKIWAGDQYNQLARYYERYPNSNIVYLTPFGKSPENYSIGTSLNEDQIICISYKTHIKGWIINCIKEVPNIPLVKEILNHYLNLINRFTNQTNNKKMEQDVINLISKDVEYYKSAVELARIVNQIDQDLYSKVFSKLLESFYEKYNKGVKKYDGLHFFTYNNYEFILKVNTEDNTIGIWLSPRLSDKFGYANDKEVVELKPLFESLKSHFDRVYENSNYTSWVYCKNDFLNYTVDQKIKLFDEVFVKELISKILSEVDIFVNTFKENAKNKGLNIHFNL